MTQVREVGWVEEVSGSTSQTGVAKSRVVSGRLDLFRFPWLRSLLLSRWLQYLLRTVTLIGFLFTLATALFGTRVGSHNFAIILVWIVWWTALKLGFIPLGGRSWCSICPIPLIGDWLQQGGITEKRPDKRGLNLRWPAYLRGSWLQSGGFLIIGLFSAVTLTDARVTGWVLLGLLILSTGMSLVFEHRAFCSHVCPISGFSGLYAKAAPLELRVVDKDICIKHESKSCYQACPWGLYPLALKDSSACGLCLECTRACPKDNLALNLRPYGSDLSGADSFNRLDEVFLALVMLASAMVFSAVFLGPWGWLKLAAYEIGSQAWWAYALGFLVFTLFLFPASYGVCVWVWGKIRPVGLALKLSLSRHAQGLLPLGLFSWMAFTVSFALPKLNLALVVLNDPFGWGWHWLGMLNPPGTWDVSRFSPYLQVTLLAVGVFWSARLTQKFANSAGNGNSHPNFPLLAFYMVYAGSLLWLLVG